MRTMMKALVLATSLALTACSTFLPPTGQQEVQQRGNLVVRVGGMQTLASPDLLSGLGKLEVILRVPGRSPISELILRDQLQEAMELSFPELPPGMVELEAKLFDNEGQVIKTIRTPVEIRIGETIQVPLTFMLEGSSATDLTFGYAIKHAGAHTLIAAHDEDFLNPETWFDSAGDPDREWTWTYRLLRPGQPEQTIVYRWKANMLTRSLDGDQPTFRGSNLLQEFWHVPVHAEYLGAGEHSRYDSSYPGGEPWPGTQRIGFENVIATPVGEKPLGIERAYAPQVGLVRESLTEDGVEIATLVLMSLEHHRAAVTN